MTPKDQKPTGADDAENSDDVEVSDDMTEDETTDNSVDETPSNNADVSADDTDDETVDEIDEEIAEEVVEDFEEELEEAEELKEAKAKKRRGRSSQGAGDTAKPRNVFVRLYRGETSYDFIGHRKIWFTVSAIIILAGLISLGTRGLNLGIDFKGGQQWSVQTNTLTVPQATTAVEGAGLADPTVVLFTNQISHQKTIQVEADLNSKTTADQTTIESAVTAALAKAAGIPQSEAADKVSFSDVGPTWGGQVTDKAILALVIFFIAVALYISFRFEFKMAIAALIAVLHDLLVTVGIYSLTGFQVTPDTVIAVLTVLGYSLYDTVVVFDRIGENSRGLGASGRITYSEMVNLSMNQTLARSINTSLVAIMPVLSVLVIGAFLLGATTLENFGLALVIGLTSGAYSSIFIASPLLAMMKEREPRYTTIRQRLETRGGDRIGILTPSAAAAMAGAATNSAARAARGKAPSNSGAIRPGAGASAAATATATRPGTGTKSGSGSSTSAKSTSSSARPTGASANRPAGTRPPPRPRKGKGKGKKR